MGARTRRVRHDDATRLKIKASQIVNALNSHVLGQNEMKPSQVTAGLGLLKKVIPDLAAVTVTGGDGGPVQVTIVGADADLL